MKTNNSLALLVGTALLVTLTGCVGYIDGPRVGHVYVEPVVVVEQDDFVYYPRYGMYYGSRSHHYYSREGSRWVPRPEPRGISANVLISSPSVSI